MSKRDYYEVLGVARNASEEELKKSYRRLAMNLPSRSQPCRAKSEASFKEAKEAYEVLSDQAKRSAYDQRGHAAFEHGMGGGGRGSGFGDVGDIFGDIFGDLFGGGRGRAGATPRQRPALRPRTRSGRSGVRRRTQDRHRDLIDCRICTGTGSADGKLDACATCRGQGRVRLQQGIFSLQQACPTCGGRGRIVAAPPGRPW